MSFFITSENPGQGANLGGLADADAYCTRLAEAAGITGKVWAAYLSTSAENARDRIGTLQGNACADWTSSDKGTAMVGHHDRTDDDGLFYCFAKT